VEEQEPKRIREILQGNNWCQGAILEDVHARELYRDTLDGCVAIVVTQSCDLLNDNFAEEPDFETVLARLRPSRKRNELQLSGKNPRRLQLYLVDLEDEPTEKLYDIKISSRRLHRKDSLLKYQATESKGIPKSSLNILARWMAKRYDRYARPDRFDRSVKIRAIEEIMVKYGTHVHSAYIRIEPDKEILESEKYNVELVFLYGGPETEDIIEASESAAKAMEEVEEVLLESEAVRDVDAMCQDRSRLTVAELDGLKYFDFDWVSGDDAPFAESRTLPGDNISRSDESFASDLMPEESMKPETIDLRKEKNDLARGKLETINLKWILGIGAAVIGVILVLYLLFKS